MQTNIRTQKTSVLIQRFLPYYKKYLPILAFDLVCAAESTCCRNSSRLALPPITSTPRVLAAWGSCWV